MTRPGFRFTFGHFVVGAIASALTYIAIRLPSFFFAALAISMVPATVWGIAQIAIASISGRQCPACGAWGLRRYAVSPFGFRYFRCEECGTRCKRGMMGGWFDASGRSDRAVYRAKDQKDPWGDGPVASLDETASGTHAVLLRSKRGRTRDPDDLLDS
jgi:hypothetical protein